MRISISEEMYLMSSVAQGGSFCQSGELKSECGNDREGLEPNR